MEGSEPQVSPEIGFESFPNIPDPQFSPPEEDNPLLRLEENLNRAQTTLRNVDENILGELTERLNVLETAEPTSPGTSFQPFLPQEEPTAGESPLAQPGSPPLSPEPEQEPEVEPESELPPLTPLTPTTPGEFPEPPTPGPEPEPEPEPAGAEGFDNKCLSALIATCIILDTSDVNLETQLFASCERLARAFEKYFEPSLIQENDGIQRNVAIESLARKMNPESDSPMSMGTKLIRQMYNVDETTSLQQLATFLVRDYRSPQGSTPEQTKQNSIRWHNDFSNVFFRDSADQFHMFRDIFITQSEAMRNRIGTIDQNLVPDVEYASTFLTNLGEKYQNVFQNGWEAKQAEYMEGETSAIQEDRIAFYYGQT
jgi:hypothetical protein